MQENKVGGVHGVLHLVQRSTRLLHVALVKEVFVAL